MREQCGIMPRFTRCGQGRGRGEERVCHERLGHLGLARQRRTSNMRRRGGGRQWRTGPVAGRTFTGSLTKHVGASLPSAWACSAHLAIKRGAHVRAAKGAEKTGEVCAGRNSWAVVRAAGLRSRRAAGARCAVWAGGTARACCAPAFTASRRLASSHLVVRRRPATQDGSASHHTRSSPRPRPARTPCPYVPLHPKGLASTGSRTCTACALPARPLSYPSSLLPCPVASRPSRRVHGPSRLVPSVPSCPVRPVSPVRRSPVVTVQSVPSCPVHPVRIVRSSW